MGALTVTLAADITALKRGMAAASELVGASARRMGRITGEGLAGIGRGGAAALQKGFSIAGAAMTASIGTIPFVDPKVGIVVYAAASLLKDTANRIGDLLDDGKPNSSFGK